MPFHWSKGQPASRAAGLFGFTRYIICLWEILRSLIIVPHEKKSGPAPPFPPPPSTLGKKVIKIACYLTY